MPRYNATAWCDRTFTARFEVEAETPDAALAKAKEQVHDEPAEECDDGFPWDTFLIMDDARNRLAAETLCSEVERERNLLRTSLRDILSRFKDCIGIGGEIDGDKEAIATAEALLKGAI